MSDSRSGLGYALNYHAVIIRSHQMLYRLSNAPTGFLWSLVLLRVAHYVQASLPPLWTMCWTDLNRSAHLANEGMAVEKFVRQYTPPHAVNDENPLC